MMKLYCIFDRLAGTFGEPFVAVKDELAIRRFNYVMQNAPMVSQDCDLYAVALYDPDHGVFPINEKSQPEFILRFEVKSV